MVATAEDLKGAGSGKGAHEQTDHETNHSRPCQITTPSPGVVFLQS